MSANCSYRKGLEKVSQHIKIWRSRGRCVPWCKRRKWTWDEKERFASYQSNREGYSESTQREALKSMFQTPTLVYRLHSAVLKAEAGLCIWCLRAAHLYLSTGSLWVLVSPRGCSAELPFSGTTVLPNCGVLLVRIDFRWAVFSQYMENMVRMQVPKSLKV